MTAVVPAPEPVPMWGTEAPTPVEGTSLSVTVTGGRGGMAVRFASTSGAAASLIFDRDEVVGLRDALAAWLAQDASDRCSHYEHLPVARHDGRPAWCVHCGRGVDGTQLVDVAVVARGLA